MCQRPFVLMLQVDILQHIVQSTRGFHGQKDGIPEVLDSTLEVLHFIRNDDMEDTVDEANQKGKIHVSDQVAEEDRQWIAVEGVANQVDDNDPQYFVPKFHRMSPYYLQKTKSSLIPVTGLE